jgi:hypothetical protein
MSWRESLSTVGPGCGLASARDGCRCGEFSDVGASDVGHRLLLVGRELHDQRLRRVDVDVVAQHCECDGLADQIIWHVLACF